MRLFIDADACPVKDETIKVAHRYQVPVFVVANGGLRPSRDPLVTHHVVPAGADAADDWIVEQSAANDITITSDIPLAARILEKGGLALNPKGYEFTEDSIGEALAMRALKQHIREAQQTQTYNRGFDTRDRSSFLQALDRLIVKTRKEI